MTSPTLRGKVHFAKKYPVPVKAPPPGANIDFWAATERFVLKSWNPNKTTASRRTARQPMRARRLPQDQWTLGWLLHGKVRLFRAGALAQENEVREIDTASGLRWR